MGALALIIIFGVLWVVSRLSPMFGQPHIRRLERFHASLAADRRKVVVCLGDSLTHGNASFDYVHALASRLEPSGYTILNAGINGDLAWNVLERIDSVVRGEPAYVVLLVGTNDARAAESEWAAKKYVRDKKLPQTPDEDFFFESYQGVLDALAGSSCTRTIVVTLPPLGERSGEPVDEIVDRFNTFIRQQAEERDLGVADLHGALHEVLPESSEDTPEYTGEASYRMIVRSILRHYLIGSDWDKIAKRHKMALLPDMVHLGETGGATLVDVVEGAVRGKPSADC